MKKASDYSDSESNVWNIAKGYVHFKILMPIIEIDNYEKIARYGCLNIEEQITITENMKQKLKLDALERYRDTLSMVIENSYFSLKKDDKKEADKIIEKLKELEEKYWNDLYDEKSNSVTNKKTIVIKEKFFKIILKKLISYKRELNGYLNNANLIFSASDDFDIEKIKKHIVDMG